MRGYPPLRTIRRAASTEARKRQRAIGEGSGTKHTLTFLTNSLTGTAKIKSCKITPKNPAQILPYRPPPAFAFVSRLYPKKWNRVYRGFVSLAFHHKSENISLMQDDIMCTELKASRRFSLGSSTNDPTLSADSDQDSYLENPGVSAFTVDQRNALGLSVVLMEMAGGGLEEFKFGLETKGKSYNVPKNKQTRFPPASDDEEIDDPLRCRGMFWTFSFRWQRVRPRQSPAAFVLREKQEKGRPGPKFPDRSCVAEVNGLARFVDMWTEVAADCSAAPRYECATLATWSRTVGFISSVVHLWKKKKKKKKKRRHPNRPVHMKRNPTRFGRNKTFDFPFSLCFAFVVPARRGSTSIAFFPPELFDSSVE
ncbi:hypothetical protein F2P81_018691 [Scophthalmus maximus]|uniref:Uncharacterized protein n=1 Tax=Scophthalmus maximus TaxID=52904 RepID=A0A6A4S2Z8_SCOMX|nr:hypothetical protein F2P81_018691 [Scophthalmus maximus]